MQTLKDVTASELILTKDGKITLNKREYPRQVIGAWRVSYPRKEHREKYGRFASQFVERIYEAYLPDASVTEYTRQEFREALVQTINRNGVKVITY